MMESQRMMASFLIILFLAVLVAALIDFDGALRHGMYWRATGYAVVVCLSLLMIAGFIVVSL